MGTAFPPKRNFIVTLRFATYKVGGGSRTRPPPYLFKTYAFEPFVGLKDTDLCTRTPFFTRLKEETVVRRDEVAWYTAKTFNAGWGLR